MDDQNIYGMPSDWKDFGVKPDSFSFTEDVMFFIILYPVVVLILQRFDNHPSIYLLPLLLLAGMLASTLNRLKTRRMLVLLPLQLGIAAAVTAAAGEIGTMITFGIIMLTVSLIAIKGFYDELMRHDVNKAPDYAVHSLYLGGSTFIICTVISYATFMAALVLREGIDVAITVVAFYIFLTVYEVYQHKSGTVSLLSGGYKSPDAGKLRSLNLIFAVCAAIVFAVLTGITYLLYYYGGLYKIDLALIAFFSQAPSGGNSYTAPPTQSAPSKMPDLGKLLKTSKKASPVNDFILNCIVYTIVVILVLLVFYFIFVQLKNLLRLRKSVGEEHESVFSLKETAQNIRAIVRRNTVFNIFRGKPNNVKVRKAYHKFVSRQIKQGAEIQRSDAPYEIMRKVPPPKDIDAATEVYEKARYSADECTEEDVDKIRRGTEPKA